MQKYCVKVNPFLSWKWKRFNLLTGLLLIRSSFLFRFLAFQPNTLRCLQHWINKLQQNGWNEFGTLITGRELLIDEL